MHMTPTRSLLLGLPIALGLVVLDGGIAVAESDGPPISHVVGGSPTSPGDWPDTAGIIGNNQVFCTGVLIAPQVVVTAGHCIDNTIQGVILDTHTLELEGEQIPSTRAIAYPNWQNTYDVGLVQLAQPSRVEPRILAHGCVKDRFIADQAPVTIVGYGAIDEFGQTYVNELMEADSVITDYECSVLSHGCNPGVQPDGELGAGGMGIDSCFGDSGGPLYLRTESGTFLVGVTSRGYADNNLPCSQGGIYTRLDSPAVRSWIESETGINLSESNCGLPPDPLTGPMEVEAGETVTIFIDPNDPDQVDGHEFTANIDPMYGLLDIVNGTVEYTAPADYLGIDSFSVTVTDNDIPRHAVDTFITVNVVEGGCGCQSSGGPTGSFWLVLGVLFFLRPSRRVKDASM